MVQGQVNPDEFYVAQGRARSGKESDPAPRPRLEGRENDLRTSRPGRPVDEDHRRAGSGPHAFSISDEEVEELARYAMIIECHYGRPMDIEWGKDGSDGRLYVLQARPETVKTRSSCEWRRVTP